MAIVDNQVYVKRDNSGLLGGQIADGAAVAERNPLSLNALASLQQLQKWCSFPKTILVTCKSLLLTNCR